MFELVYPRCSELDPMQGAELFALLEIPLFRNPAPISYPKELFALFEIP